jgi:hypothetical protein
MIVKIDRNKSIFDTNSWLKNYEEFSSLNEKEMRYVALYADTQGPFTRHPEQERKRLAALDAGWVVQDTHEKTLQPRAREAMNGQNEKVSVAIEKYRSLCPPDQNRELLMLYTQQIQNIKDAVNAKPTDPAELLKVNNLLLSLPDLNKACRELARSVGMEDELGKIEEEVKKNRSTIDKVINEQLKNETEES